MANSTYSFADVNIVIAHDGVGQFIADGQGIGSIGVAMSTERTTHDIAADGSIMISKIPGDNGIISISAQQTSPIHNWLVKWFNYLRSAPTSEWAKTSITIRAITMGDVIDASEVAPQKLADRPYQAQGQQVVWNLLAAKITQEGN